MRGFSGEEAKFALLGCPHLQDDVAWRGVLSFQGYINPPTHLDIAPSSAPAPGG